MSNSIRVLRNSVGLLFVGIALSSMPGCSGAEGGEDYFAAEADDPGLDAPDIEAPGDGELDSMYSATGTAGSKAPGVIAKANSQVGVPYSWGGGNKNGPTYGIAQGAKTKGFDCSGLMEYAFFQGAQKNIGGVTSEQLKHAKVISTAQRKPGDLLFYGAGSNPHHVALYVGKNAKTGVEYMIEAPRTGLKVRWAKLRTEGLRVARVSGI